MKPLCFTLLDIACFNLTHRCTTSSQICLKHSSLRASHDEKASGSPACLMIFAVYNPPSVKSKPSTSNWDKESMPFRYQQGTLPRRLSKGSTPCNC